MAKVLDFNFKYASAWVLACVLSIVSHEAKALCEWFLASPAVVEVPAQYAPALNELKISKVVSGRNYKIVGGLVREKTLVIGADRFDAIDLSGLAKLMQVLFAEKQRQLRWALPKPYSEQLLAFSEKLKAIAPEIELPKFNYLTYGLRSLFGFWPGAKKLWPATDPRLKFHWALTRTFAAVLVAISLQNVSHLPDALDFYYSMDEINILGQTVVGELNNVTSGDLDQKKIQMIAHYQAEIEAIETQLLSSHEQSELLQRLESLKAILLALKS